MFRDFSHVNVYLDNLMLDIYEQPEDVGHTNMLKRVMNRWISSMSTCKSVLDVGCGATAFAEPFFKELGIEYTGVTLGKDYITAKEAGKNVYNMDMTFLDFPNDSFDLVFSRHSLEHSFSPILSLMEWHRVAKNWLCVILPNPNHYKWVGLNHYSVMHPSQIEHLMKRSEWNVIWTDFSEPSELRYMAEKERRSLYEMKTGDET